MSSTIFGVHDSSPSSAFSALTRRFGVSYSTCAIEIVMPRSRSSGALSISSKLVYVVDGSWSCRTFVIAAVSVVFPWSMWPIVPMFRCGFVRSNFCFDMGLPRAPLLRWLLASDAGDDLLGDGLGHLLVRVELHGVRRSALGARAEVGSVAEHLRQRHLGTDDVRVPALLHPLDPSSPRRQVAEHVAHVILGRDDLDCHDRI